MIRSTPHYEVLIVGGGFAGIGLGVQLRHAGLTDFAILERRSAVGGTWYDNRYPGIACDVPAHVYSYSFKPHTEWSSYFAPGPEIQKYLEWVAHDEGLFPHIRFGVDVEDMRWDETTNLWKCETTAGTITCRALIVACGRLSEPRYPDVPGLDTFARGNTERISVHSARWPEDLDLTDKRVAVVGSGASAIQLVPSIAPRVRELTVLQRSAPYIVPRKDRVFTDRERRMFKRAPNSLRAMRDHWFWNQEKVFAQRALVESEVATARAVALDHLFSQVPDPVLREQLTPDYEIGCKRVLLSDTYYPAFLMPNVHLIDSALAAVEPGTLVAANGQRVDADVVIFATGFQSSPQPYAEKIHGDEYQSLADEWTDGMYAHASTTVPGFPNLFVMNGPNAGLGHNSAIVMIESQIRYIIEAVRFLESRPDTTIRVRRDVADSYTSRIGELSAESVWVRGGCESWYRDSRSGKLTLLWPGTSMSFRSAVGSFNPDDYVLTDPSPRKVTTRLRCLNSYFVLATWAEVSDPSRIDGQIPGRT